MHRSPSDAAAGQTDRERDEHSGDNSQQSSDSVPGCLSVAQGMTPAARNAGELQQCSAPLVLGGGVAL